MINKQEIQVGDSVLLNDCEYNKIMGVAGLTGDVVYLEHASSPVISIFISEDQPMRHLSLLSKVEVESILN